jgi:oligoendopeptidase F
MVDEFQHIVYAKPEMTPAERKQVWLNLEKEYRPHMDYGDDAFYSKGGFWQRQSHIFQCPFYYIDYCLASICAMQFKVMMNEDFQKAWENYLKLCNLSAKDFFINVIQEAGLENPFEDGCIKQLVEKISACIF